MLSGLAALAGLFVSGNASASRIEGFNSRAAYASDQPCVASAWTGVYNVCNHNVQVQAAATVTTSGNFYPNVMAFADEDSTFQPWGVSSNLDTVWTPGASRHGNDFYGHELWASYPSTTPTYVPANGALLFSVWLPINEKIAAYFY